VQNPETNFCNLLLAINTLERKRNKIGIQYENSVTTIVAAVLKYAIWHGETDLNYVCIIMRESYSENYLKAMIFQTFSCVPLCSKSKSPSFGQRTGLCS